MAVAGHAVGQNGYGATSSAVGVAPGALEGRIRFGEALRESDFAVAPLGPWLTLILATLAAPLQAVGLALLRLASREHHDKLECVDWLPEDVRRPVVGFFGFLLLVAGLAVSSLEMLMGAGIHDQGLDAVIVMRKVVLLLQCTQVLLCYALERFLVTCVELPHLQTKVCAAVWLGCSLLEWAAPWPHDDTAEVLGNQRASCDDGFRALFTFVYFPLWATSLCFGVLVITCLADGSSGRGDEYDDALVEENEDKSSDSEEEEETEDIRRRERLEQRRKAHERKGYNVREPAGKLFRRVLLPLIYGFATSASGLLIATGWTTVEWRVWAIFGCVLLLIAASCALDWVLRLQLSLGVWAPLSQCCATLLRLFQGHLIFRDFRWSAAEGFEFSVGKKPGVYCFLTGVTILLAVLLLYVLTYRWNEWLKSEASHQAAEENGQVGRALTDFPAVLQRSMTRQMTRFSDGRAAGRGEVDGGLSLLQLLHVLLLPLCFACYLKGVTSPLYHYSICTPDVQWVNGQAAFERARSSMQERSGTQSCIGHTMGFVDSITWLYDNHMPFSAILAAYRSLVGPPLEFLAIIGYLILQPLGLVEIPAPVLGAMRKWLVKGAPSKFATNCMVCILYVTIIQSADPGGNSFQATFARGFGFMLMYCVSYIALVRSLKEEDPLLQEREPSIIDPHEGHSQEKSDNSEESLEAEEEEAPLGERICDWWATAKDVTLALLMVVVVICALYYSITTSFISLDFRYEGTKLLKIQPVLLELWRTLLEENYPVAVFAAGTMVFLLLLRIVLWLLLRTAYRDEPPRGPLRHGKSHSSCSFKRVLEFFEALAAQFTLCHIWAESIVLLWLGILTRNRDQYQVCASLPSPPLGLVAICVLGLGGTSLQILIPKAAVAPPSPHRGPVSLSRLPGGPLVWGGGFTVVFIFWAGLMTTSGPTLFPKSVTRDEVNEVLFELLPRANERMLHVIPESKGSCEQLWQKELHQHPDCEGREPLARILTEQGFNVDVLWATGLNKVVLTEMSVDQPRWIIEYTDQRWDLTVSGVFTHLKVWVKAAKHGEDWINNYICCDKNFSFTVQASVVCTLGTGFHDVTLRMVKMDRPEMESTVTKWDLPDSHGMLTVDYGDVDTVGKLDLKKVIEDYMRGRIGGGQLLMRTSDGPPLDVMDYVKVRLQEVVELNTRPQRSCPLQPPPPTTTTTTFTTSRTRTRTSTTVTATSTSLPPPPEAPPSSPPSAHESPRDAGAPTPGRSPSAGAPSSRLPGASPRDAEAPVPGRSPSADASSSRLPGAGAGADDPGAPPSPFADSQPSRLAGPGAGAGGWGEVESQEHLDKARQEAENDAEWSR